MGTFALSCPECGKIGAAELWESGGWSYTHHRAWALNVSYDFGLVAPTTGEPPAMLACLAWARLPPVPKSTPCIFSLANRRCGRWPEAAMMPRRIPHG